MTKINVLSLFDGMSCAQIALERAGIEVDRYYASEVDKYAIAVTQHNYPNTIQLGDVTKWREWDIDWAGIDLLIGGSPCQGLSHSGRGEGLKDARSALFFDYIDILEHIKKHNPNAIFVLENVVPQKKEWAQNMSSVIGVDFIEINSSLVSAQSRRRLYWTNIDGIEQPEDREIYLQDIIESVQPDSMKSYCIDASYFKGGNLVQYFEKSRRQLVFDAPIQVGYIGKNQQGRGVYDTNGKSVALKSGGGGWGAKMGLYLVPTTYSRKSELSGKVLNKSLPLESSNWRGLNRNQRQTAIAGMLDSGDIAIRKLTPTECEELQTVPQNYTLAPHPVYKNKMMSNTQRYKMLGNGFTVDVIAHILSYANFG
jgi:DNA (cytosine-5)-methyltransferase 1